MERTCQACGETFLQLDACELCERCRKCNECSLNYTCKLDELIEDLRQLQTSSMLLTHQAKLKRSYLTYEAQNDMDKLQKVMAEVKEAKSRMKAINKALGIE